MPRVDDDGATVPLNLHGHSATGSGRRTIKTALHDALDDGFLAGYAAGALRLGLDRFAAPDPTPITLRDVWQAVRSTERARAFILNL
ncbi:hypothetical protein [Salisaeta longa]|uniref:hypothetical protein n=1 Tax=Salisaeta longa TaxID=503170 RepID=UPI0003B53017|nr:hypothetical protein [Salisaeta longa]